MKSKAFKSINSVAMAVTFMAALASLLGIYFTGLYPGIVILCLLTLIPVASKMYVKKLNSKPDGFRKNNTTILTWINLLCIMVVLWMTFVIVHDRVLKDCC